MIAELGHFALILALPVALLQSTLPLYASFANIPAWMALAKPAARAQLLLTAVAFAALMHAFINSDFSLIYVANHSNSHLPLIYRISGVWGGHEGSLLLWSLLLAVWGAAVAHCTRALPAAFSARVLAVMAMISVGFLLFMLFTSNPFARQFPAPLDGNDLNPLLQDIGLALHPPMLYTGYVGFSVAFAFAVAALLGGRVDAAWAKWARPWTNFAWAFLTVGIALGSWWAYYELGWGGWWFWDPVENASFMPWLAGSALIHSLAATEKRGVFKAWTLLLAIAAFSLSLLGTFLVRSGVLSSVHAFATDPARGLFILIFLGVVVGGALALFAWRAPGLASRARYELVSRETAILINNLLFGALCFAVLLGTLYPLILDALSGEKISVGPPYFDFLFAAIGAPLIFALGVGAMLRWKNDSAMRAAKKLIAAFALSIAAGFAIPFFMPHYSPGAALGLTLGCWAMFSALAALHAGGASLRAWPWRWRVTRATAGMVIAHFGAGVFIVGVTFTNAYGVERDVRIAENETRDIAGYAFTFDGVSEHRGANYDSTRGAFRVRDGAREIILHPEKRVYLVQKNPMTEAAIDAGFTRDLYVALGEPLGDGAWSARIYYKPFIRWIWLGALLMACGGALAATDARYRMRAPAESAAALGARA